MFWLRMEGTDMWGECRGYGRCGENGRDIHFVGRMEGIWMVWLRMEGTDMWGECRGYGCCGENGGDMDGGAMEDMDEVG